MAFSSHFKDLSNQPVNQPRVDALTRMIQKKKLIQRESDWTTEQKDLQINLFGNQSINVVTAHMYNILNN